MTIATAENEGFIITATGLHKCEKPKLKFDSHIEEQLVNNLDRTLQLDALRHMVSSTGQVLIPKWDSNESVFLRESLTAMIKDVIATWYPNYTAKTVFPINTRIVGAGLEKVKFVEKSFSGEAVIIGSKTTKIPFVDVEKDPTYVLLHDLGLAAKYTWKELQQAMLGMEPLVSDRLEWTKEGQERAINKLIYGISTDPAAASDGGLFNQVSELITSSDHTDLTNHNLLAGTASDNRGFLMKAINVPHIFTGKIEAEPDTLVMPIEQAKLINRQALSDNNNVTVAKYIIDNTNIKQIIAAPECKNVNKNSITDALLIFKKTPDIVEIMQTLPYTVLPTQVKVFNFTIPTITAIARKLFIYKKAIALVKNCGA